MKELIRHILKEEINDQQETREKKGIDIAVKLLKKSYPYVVGWEYNINPYPSKFYIVIDLKCDIEKLKEFYNSDIKSYYQRFGSEELKKTVQPYPFSILEIGQTMDPDDKFQIYKDLKQELNDFYLMLPEDLLVKNVFDEPKELDPDKFTYV